MRDERRPQRSRGMDCADEENTLRPRVAFSLRDSSSSRSTVALLSFGLRNFSFFGFFFFRIFRIEKIEI
jgi:hypothetical protein